MLALLKHAAIVAPNVAHSVTGAPHGVIPHSVGKGVAAATVRDIAPHDGPLNALHCFAARAATALQGE